MKFDITDKATQMLLLGVVKSALYLLGNVLPKGDLEEVADLLLNKLEGLWEEDSWKDNMAEMVAGVIRNQLDVEDSDPDN